MTNPTPVYTCGLADCHERRHTYDDIVGHMRDAHPGITPPAPPLTDDQRIAAIEHGDPHPDLAELDRAIDARLDEMQAAATTDEGTRYAPAIPAGGHDLNVNTSMTSEQFQQWLAADGEIFVVYMPNGKSFPIKVPPVHNEFFVAMMQQVRFTLGETVQAIRMLPMTGQPEAVQPRDDQGYAMLVGDTEVGTVTADAIDDAIIRADYDRPPTEHQPRIAPRPEDHQIATTTFRGADTRFACDVTCTCGSVFTADGDTATDAERDATTAQLRHHNQALGLRPIADNPQA